MLIHPTDFLPLQKKRNGWKGARDKSRERQREAKDRKVAEVNAGENLQEGKRK